MFSYFSQYLLDHAAGTAWAEWLSPLRVFRYITFRSAGAAVTALLLSLWLGPRVIRWLKELKFEQNYADKAEEGGGLAARVLSKKNVPTMASIVSTSPTPPASLRTGNLKNGTITSVMSTFVSGSCHR